MGRNKLPKSINSLMAYMRDKKNISISGSTQKKKLRNMGYFHGYKGYRYHSNPQNKFSFSSFNELQAVYDFDMGLKTLFYPRIMFLETAIKNYVLEVIMAEANSCHFNDIYNKVLTDYKSYTIGTNLYNRAQKDRITLRNAVYSVISRDYGKRYIVKHYYEKDQPLPIWAIFELLSLGEFANFINCINVSTNKKISTAINLNISLNSDGKLLSEILFVLKDLRNAVAHNNTIFDTRFHIENVNKRIGNYITSETQINNITFKTIVDYVVLVSLLMKNMNCPKTDILMFIKEFDACCEAFRKQVDFSIYTSVVYTDTRKKIQSLKKWL